MVKSTLIQLSPKELANFISCALKLELIKFTANPKVKDLISTDKPHLTRKETAKFFDVSLNCINDWSKKEILQPFKVGQRTYFKKSDLIDVLFS
ncbi:helix-turn-helix domain-containing protein [Polaribacter sp. 11A2H]|uniref:helix-turn-helix domain-containing protein n=1 Tax=Polaribacter sp. 11A2H TaxID=2687290 RepID=UPI00140E4458|nr:helix-turn-helix domain-containing protein [Polaribacter sp. 11A2H]